MCTQGNLEMCMRVCVLCMNVSWKSSFFIHLLLFSACKGSDAIREGENDLPTIIHKNQQNVDLLKLLEISSF